MPCIVAHRGYKSRYPENTLAAFTAAIASGAHAIECDIQFSRDQVPMIIHDVDLARTTGRTECVFDLDHGELIQIAADREMPCAQTADINIPQLSGLMKLIMLNPEVRFFIEIKPESLQHFGTEVVMQKLVKMLQPFQSQCIIISYETTALMYVQQHSTLATGWVLHHYNEIQHKHAVELKPDYLICNYNKLPVDQVPWQGPWQWMLYEINDTALAESWIQRKIDYIETANVSALRKSVFFSPAPIMSDKE